MPRRWHIPESCRGVEIVVGIDEAGRGPVLGCLVYCAAFWPLSKHEEIVKLAFDDSKALKEEEREKMFSAILSHEHIGYCIDEITPEAISRDMLRASPVSLNAISYNSVIGLLQLLIDATNNPPIIGDVYIDTVGDPETYKSRLISGLGVGYGRFTIEKKADATYKVVGAASIIAKVTRDKGLAASIVGGDCGSGYPSDERCVAWLQRNMHPVFGYPQHLVRFSWSTIREVFEKNGAHRVEWECDEEVPDGGAITSFFSGAGGVAKRKRCDYYTRRKMTRIAPAEFTLGKCLD